MGNSFSSEKTKQCSACEKYKPISEYHNNSKRPDGKRDRCPDCIIKKKPRVVRAEPAEHTDKPGNQGKSSESPNTRETRNVQDDNVGSTARAGYMYVIIEREFIKTNEHVYKIGMTNQYDPRRRLQNYPHDSRVLLLIEKPDARRSENIVKDLLKAHREIIHRMDIGAEYFEGDPVVIVNIVFMA